MHVRCPHCQNAIELVGEQALTDVTCPSCGSSFNLLPPTEPHWQSKRSIAHFQLVEHLGTGGFGSVWKAQDTKLDRPVAIKIPRFDHTDSEHTELFLREARATAQLRHPHIVAVHEVGREDGTLYIVSDFVQGITLADRLTAGPLPIREAAELVAVAADALHHAHEAGVIHRDLKPQNIMLDAAGHPHLMDFGLAKREAGEITMTIDGKVLGTPAYMSPEQARGEGHTVDRRTDVYSLGVILFELLTGERPFRGNRAMLLHQVIHEDAPTPRKLNSRVPRDLETICLKCLEKDPRGRYGSAAEVVAELRRWLEGLPIVARPIGRLERAWRWSRRKPLVAGLSAAVAATLVTGTLVSTLFGLSARDLADKATKASGEAKAQAKRATLATIQAKADADRAKKAAAVATAESKRAFRHYYAIQMNLAQRDWEGNDTINLLTRLQRTMPEHTGGVDLRGFEWHYWDRQCHADLLSVQCTVRGHVFPAFSVAFHPDGRRFVTGGFDNTVRTWETASGRPLLLVQRHSQSVRCVAYNHDGTRIASCSDDRTIRIYDAEDGRELRALSGHTDQVTSVAFSHDGTRIVSGSMDGTARVWDSITGDHQRTIPCPAFVFGVAFALDSSRIVTAGDGAKIWDAGSGQLLHSLPNASRMLRFLAVSPNGRRIACCGEDNFFKIWDAADGHELLVIAGHAAPVSSVAFNENGTQVVSGSDDCTIKVWNVATGQEIVSYKSPASCVALTRDATRIVSTSHDGYVKVWDATQRREPFSLRRTPYRVCGVFFRGNEKWLIGGSASGEVKVWDAASRRELLALRGLAGPVRSVQVNRAGTRIVGGGEGDVVKVWDAATGQDLLTLNGHAGFVPTVAFDRAGTRIVTTTGDNNLKIWDATSGQLLHILRGHSSLVRSAAFSEDGRRIVSGSNDFTASLWDAIEGRRVFTTKQHEGPIAGIAITQDGSRLITGSIDGTIKIWETGNGHELFTLRGHSGGITCIAVNALNRIVSGGFDQTIRIWDADTAQELLALRGHKTVLTHAAWSPEGTEIVSAGDDQIFLEWNGRPRANDPVGP